MQSGENVNMSEIMKDPEMMKMLQEKFNSLEGRSRYLLIHL